MPHGRLHRGLPRLRLGSAQRDLRRPHATRSRNTPCRRSTRATRPSSRSPSRAAAPIPAAQSRRARRRRATATSSTARRSGSPASARRNGAWFSRAPARARAATASPPSSSRRSSRASAVEPIPVIRSYSPYEIISTTARCRRKTASARRAGASSSPRTGWSTRACPTRRRASASRRRRSTLAIDWAKQRQTFGAALADKQAIQWMIADSEIELRAARLLVHQAAGTGRSRPRHQGRRLGREGLRDRDRRQGRRPLHPDVRRPRRRQGNAARALVSRDCASSASAKGRRRSTAW